MARKYQTYAVRKTAASAFLDIALFMANVSQMKVLCEAKEGCVYNTRDILMLVLVSISMILQLNLGFLLIYLGRKECQFGARFKVMNPDPLVSDPAVTEERLLSEDIEQNFFLNTVAACVIFAILVINIVISGMGLGYGNGQRIKSSGMLEGVLKNGTEF